MERQGISINSQNVLDTLQAREVTSFLGYILNNCDSRFKNVNSICINRAWHESDPQVKTMVTCFVTFQAFNHGEGGVGKKYQFRFNHAFDYGCSNADMQQIPFAENEPVTLRLTSSSN